MPIPRCLPRGSSFNFALSQPMNQAKFAKQFSDEIIIIAFTKYMTKIYKYL